MMRLSKKTNNHVNILLTNSLHIQHEKKPRTKNEHFGDVRIKIRLKLDECALTHAVVVGRELFFPYFWPHTNTINPTAEQDTTTRENIASFFMFFL